MSTLRPRNPFVRRGSSETPYSDEDEDDGAALDEEEQERVIETLARADARSNALYRKLSLCIPVLGGLYFLTELLSRGGSTRERSTAVLALSSLAATGYILVYLPGRTRSDETVSSTTLGRRMPSGGDDGPLDKYIVYLNGTLAGLMLVAAALAWGKERPEEAFRATAPAVVFGMALVVRRQLTPLDLDELKRARYELKGA